MSNAYDRTLKAEYRRNAAEDKDYANKVKMIKKYKSYAMDMLKAGKTDGQVIGMLMFRMDRSAALCVLNNAYDEI